MFQGVLTKMQTEIKTPVDYYLVFKDSFVHVNSFLEKKYILHARVHNALTAHSLKKYSDRVFVRLAF